MLLLRKTHAEWAALSGLTPAASYSTADHALHALRAYHSEMPQNLSINDYLAAGLPPDEQWVETARNRILNPKLEENTTGYMVGGTITFVDSFTRLSVTATWASYNRYILAPSIPVTSEETLTISVDTKSETGTTVALYFRAYDSEGAEIGTVTFSPSFGGEASEVRGSMSVEVPADATTIRVGVASGETMNNGDSFDVRHLMAGGESYFDGDTEGDEDTRYSWAGTPNASESIKEELQ